MQEIYEPINTVTAYQIVQFVILNKFMNAYSNFVHRSLLYNKKISSFYYEHCKNDFNILLPLLKKAELMKQIYFHLKFKLLLHDMQIIQNKTTWLNITCIEESILQHKIESCISQKRTIMAKYIFVLCLIIALKL